MFSSLRASAVYGAESHKLLLSYSTALDQKVLKVLKFELLKKNKKNDSTICGKI